MTRPGVRRGFARQGSRASLLLAWVTRQAALRAGAARSGSARCGRGRCLAQKCDKRLGAAHRWCRAWLPDRARRRSRRRLDPCTAIQSAPPHTPAAPRLPAAVPPRGGSRYHSRRRQELQAFVRTSRHCYRGPPRWRIGKALRRSEFTGHPRGLAPRLAISKRSKRSFLPKRGNG